MASQALSAVLQRRFQRLVIFALVILTITFLLLNRVPQGPHTKNTWRLWRRGNYDWAHREMKHPIDPESVVRPPLGTPRQLPQIQHNFSQEPKDEAREQILAERRDEIRNAVKKCWMSYRKYAWGYDELRPLTHGHRDTFAGWGATLVDSLDTLWIMGLEDEFREALQAVAFIDWNDSTSSSCSVFETNIRYLGGLLSAYDLSGDPLLLSKALELGNMLYAAFDTPGHMPVNQFNFVKANAGRLVPDSREAFASVATLSLEFTRLSQLTGDNKFYTVIHNIKNVLNRTQDSTELPGMWPMFVDLKNGFVADGTTFTLGAQADSGYEYLPKMYALLGGLDDVYATMHKKAMETAQQHLLFRAMIPPDDGPAGQLDVLFPGNAVVSVSKTEKKIDLVPRLQHLGCFTGGLFALGGRLLGRGEDVEIGERLARGCAWAYGAMPSGVMPEVSMLVPCTTADLVQCEWDDERWKKETRYHPSLPKGFHQVKDPRYLLRPEAIESLFVLYRVTGKRELQDMAWEMFLAIARATETEFGFASVVDVRAVPSENMDSMESFWIAETLKYLYLIFSDPDVISLDDYVLNTEAHPFRIPKPGDNAP